MSATDILGKIGEKVGTEIKSVKDNLSAHTSDQTNPHSVNKSQVGLGNVENTALSTFAGSANITTLGTIASGTIPYSLVSGAPDPNAITGDLSISGNLQVNGTQTILNTQKLEVEDNIIELNLKSDGSETAQTSGIEINRGEDAESNALDKAKIIWDDSTSRFRLKLGGAAADLVVDKIYNNNMFSAISDLPSATQYHGMMAHVHATGQSYFAHAGNWVELISVSGGQTIAGTVAATSFLAPDKDGLKINGVSLGDYSTFENALTTAMA